MVAMLAMVVFFNSCEKEITTTELVLDETKKGTLKVYAKAELDPEEVGLEAIPTTVFNISIKKSELNPDFNATGRWVAQDTAIGGMFEIEVPTTDDGVTVFVEAVSFESEVEVGRDSVELRKYFTGDEKFTVKAGDKEIHSITLSHSVLEERFPN